MVANEFVAYRAFHLVVERFNKCISSVLALFLLSCGASQVVSAALLVQQTKTNLKISLPLNLFFVLAVIETILIIMVVFGYPGDFHQDSKNTLAMLRRKILHKIILPKKRMYCKTFLRSCSVLKIRFGLANFIEKSTPSVFQLFCANRIIDVLLTQSKS